MDEGKLWSLIRNVLTQGGAIQLDRASMSSYEEYSARLDAAAAERVADFTKLADARIAELEREIERLDAQWRDELRIYRETDGVDVERYRWLRDRGGLDPDTPWCVFQGKDWHGRNELDAAIDAARANGGGE